MSVHGENKAPRNLNDVFLTVVASGLPGSATGRLGHPRTEELPSPTHVWRFPPAQAC